MRRRSSRSIIRQNDSASSELGRRSPRVITPLSSPSSARQPLVGLSDRILGGGQAGVRILQHFLSVLDGKLVLIQRCLDLTPVGIERCELLLVRLLTIGERCLVRLKRRLQLVLSALHGLLVGARVIWAELTSSCALASVVAAVVWAACRFACEPASAVCAASTCVCESAACCGVAPAAVLL